MKEEEEVTEEDIIKEVEELVAHADDSGEKGPRVGGGDEVDR